MRRLRGEHAFRPLESSESREPHVEKQLVDWHTPLLINALLFTCLGWCDLIRAKNEKSG